MKMYRLVASIAVLSFLSVPALSQTDQAAPDQSTTGQATTGQTTDTAATTNRNDDNETDWGWIGIIGLAGLAGLMRRRDPVSTRTNPTGSDSIRSGRA